MENITTSAVSAREPGLARCSQQARSYRGVVSCNLPWPGSGLHTFLGLIRNVPQIRAGTCLSLMVQGLTRRRFAHLRH
jgi:hypothetical protein